MPTSPVFAFLRREFVDGRESGSSTIMGHLNRVACADHRVMVLMEFLTRLFPSREPAIQNLLGRDARMRLMACGGIFVSTASECA